jgi:uncharacterized damage-inducible protein DinB
MHARTTLLKARLSAVRKDFMDVIQSIGPDDLTWSPAVGMRTVSGQLVEIIITEIQLLSRLRDDKWIDDPTAIASLGDTTNLDNFIQWAGQVRQETLAHLESLSEAELAAEIAFDAGWFGSLGLSLIPRAEVFLNIADHEWYHVGQLTSYLWARGVNPYT